MEGNDEQTVLIEHGLNLSTDELLVGFIIKAPSALHWESLNGQQEHFPEVQGQFCALQSCIAPTLHLVLSPFMYKKYVFTKRVPNFVCDYFPFISSCW